MKEPYCTSCEKTGHYKTFCRFVKRKPIPKQSDKEKEYQAWKEEVARTYLINKYRNKCNCCNRPAFSHEKLDIDHILGKGSRIDLKTNLNNIQFLCRYPCHDNKTNNRVCEHDIMSA